jgi:hypothetical protein
MAIAPETFLRKAPLAITASGSAWWWRMLIYLVRIPRCQGALHTTRRAQATEAAASTA